MQQQQHPYRRGPQARNTLRGGTVAYSVKAGREFRLAPEYENVDASTVYLWSCNGEILSRSATLSCVFDRSGCYDIRISAANDAGTSSADANPLGSRRGAARDLARSAPRKGCSCSPAANIRSLRTWPMPTMILHTNGSSAQRLSPEAVNICSCRAGRDATTWHSRPKTKTAATA